MELIKLGDRIFLARDRKAMTQRTLAEALGVRASHLSRWETGKVEPRSDVLVSVASVCEVSLDWLLTGEGRPEIPKASQRAAGYADREPMVLTSRGWVPQGEAASDVGVASSSDAARLPVWLPASSGDPRGLATSQQADGYIVLSREMAPSGVIALRVVDDAMSPAIIKGAVVGVDSTDRKLADNAVFAVWSHSDGLVLRRAVLGAGVLRADNPLYCELGSPSADEVLGRMRWCVQSY